MGKAGRWLRSFLTGKKVEKKPEAMPVAAAAAAGPKEKKRWSFRRPGKAVHSPEPSVCGGASLGLSASEGDFDQKKHAMAVDVATAAAADAAVAAAQAAAAVVRLTAAGETHGQPCTLAEEAAAAAVRIQATFRGYLARKALCALRGLVKLQALVRGHLVRKQANATLRCMQALVAAQSRVRAQRMRMVEEAELLPNAQPLHRRPPSPSHPRSRRSYEMERAAEENVKIVEVDSGQPPRSVSRGRSSCSAAQVEPRDRRNSEYLGGHPQYSPAPSARTELSPRAYSGHFEEFSFATAQSSPQYLSAICVPDDMKYSPLPPPPFEFFPNYMANTESSRAKARSQSAPKQRTDAAAAAFDRQPSRRRPAPTPTRGAKMQRSSSHVGAAAHGYQYPPAWPVKLDRSSASLHESECGSTSSVFTANTGFYCRSLVGFEVPRNKY